MRKLTKQWVSLILSVLLVFCALAAAAEETEWSAQAWDAFDRQDYETSLRYFCIGADEGNQYAQYMAACHYYFGFGTEVD